MSVLNENTIIGASAAGEYEIEQSLRFNDDDGSYLSWTPASAGNRKTWTWSGWVKRTNIDTTNVVFSSYVDSSNFFGIRLRENGDNGALEVFNFSSGNDLNLTTTQKFRDPSAWYHIVLAIDTTQGTNTNRVKIYINGSQVTDFGVATYPSQNFDTDVNNTNAHYVGSLGTGNYHDGYLAEVNFIDGLALTPDSFGETGKYGEWKPLKYTGAYGTNGFYLPFEQDYTVEGFSTVTYEGTGAAQYIGGTGFQPDFTWIKSRSDIQNNVLFDSVRGSTAYLRSNTTGAESTNGETIKSFDSDGFELGTAFTNEVDYTYVAWNWDMGGTTASNTSGSITSSVRANTTYGQSIVSYTGNATSGATIGHGLNAVPTMIIVKDRSATNPWVVYHHDLGINYYTLLNDTDSSYSNLSNYWSGTTPSSTVFGVNTYGGNNANGNNYIAYCFADVTGYSKFGSYSGNATADNAITTGFTPAFLMIKRTDATGDWMMFDNARNPTQPDGGTVKALFSNTSGVESDTYYGVQFTATGFNLQYNDSSATNASGGTYIYMAFADTREYAYWYDQSGNNNDWTSEGGLTESDVMLDSPTNNFCTFNPLDQLGTLSEGNLKGTPTASKKQLSTFGASTGKWYWEFYIGGASTLMGVADLTSCNIHNSDHLGSTAYGWGYYTNGLKYNNNVGSSYGATFTTGDIIGVEVDLDGGTVTFYKNSVSQGQAYSNLTTGGTFGPANSNGSYAILNTGQDSSFAGNKTPQGNSDSNGIGDFYYAPSSGFLALCTANLPEVDVIPSENFNTIIYSGNGASPRSLTGINFQPDLVWNKARSVGFQHDWADSVRGGNKILHSNSTGAEDVDFIYGYLNSFDADGFTMQAGSTSIENWNKSGETYVAWNWKAGGSAVSNTNGTITSSVSANPSAGFSIVSWSGDGGSGTVGHSLSQKPQLLIQKNRTNARNWYTFTDIIDGSNDYLKLDTTSAAAATGMALPTSSVFTNDGWTSSESMISYCFHSVDGYSKVGSYTGNGSADGTFVHCGFRPAVFIFKRTDTASDWIIMDTKRDFYNVADKWLYPNGSYAEENGSVREIDFISNGVKIRTSTGGLNASGGTYIFLAFAENPFKHTNAR